MNPTYPSLYLRQETNVSASEEDCTHLECGKPLESEGVLRYVGERCKRSTISPSTHHTSKVQTHQSKAQPRNATHPTPHNPSRPSPTGDLTGKALAEPPHAFIHYSTKVRVRASPSETRRERRWPPGGLTIDGRLTPEACGVL